MTTSPKRCASGQRCQPATIREAWHCQVHHAGVEVVEIARALDVSPTYIRDAVNPNSFASMLSARHWLPVLELTRANLAVLTFLARAQHAAVFPLPTGSPLAQTADVVREFGELLTTMATAYDDGLVTGAEADRVIVDGEQAIAAIARVVEDARRRGRHERPLAASGGLR